MCGIAGYFGLTLIDEERSSLIRRMVDTIIYRGPDDEGYYADDIVGLGMRRLSIIDLESGHQPIGSPDGSRQIIFNGEIFNYRELRTRLQGKGYKFSTNSDTEVILHQYEHDGADCVHFLNGMFALAIWDRSKRTLFLARDRMGIKPLYYYWDGKHFLFASEIKALLASGYVLRELNHQALWDYLTFRYVPQPESIWQNVHKLLPGHTLTISLNSPEPFVKRYWDIPYEDQTFIRSEAEIGEEFAELFLDSVRLRLIADVPVGILLSGGLDSSSVAAGVAELHNAKLSSFSVAFEDSPLIDELPFARQMANRVGTDHNEIIIGQQEFCDFLPDFVHYTDEPLADLASIPLYYVSKLARQNVKVVLSGEGSDEVLGGYDLDLWVDRWDREVTNRRLPTWFPSPLSVQIARLLGPKVAEFIRRVASPNDLRLLHEPPNMTNHLNSAEKRALFREPPICEDSMLRVRDEVARVRSNNPLNQLLYVFCQSWLVEDLLMKADRMSMANSIELRTPFLDYRLVEWAAKIPASAKVGMNEEGNYQTKRVLRSFAEGRIPEEIIRRPKMGFPVPLYDWVSGPLKMWAFELLGSSDTYLNRWFRSEALQQQLQDATGSDSSLLDKHRLWDLIILEIWCREWRPA